MAETLKAEEELNNILFFRVLEAKLAPGMLRKRTHAAAAESHGRLNEAIETYFRQCIIWDLVTRSVSSSALEKETETEKHFLHPKAARSHRFYENGIRRNFSGELADDLLCPVTLLKKNEKLREEVEVGFKDTCGKIASCCDDGLHWKISDRNWVKSFEKVMRKQSLKVANLEVEREVLHLERKNLDKMILDYYKELSEGVCLLYKLASLRESSLQFGHQLAHFFSLRCAALLFKMRLAEAKALYCTYTEDSILALKKIDTRMGEKVELLSAKLNDGYASLHAYRQLGGDFEKLAAEYSELVASADRLRWSSNTLLERRQALKSGSSTD